VPNAIVANDQLCVNVIRGLAMDAVEAAGSGHPGMPMGCADIAHVLWTQFLKYDPRSPEWPDRDRFVLSAGHGSMLLYAMLYLTGYDLSLDDLRSFRQWGSITPGHPENGITPGVEMATGPLGQGVSTAVGMAVAERFLRHKTPGMYDHRTYVIASDGDLMEGISHEACAWAGHQALDRLTVLYDDNRITIDGPTSLAYSEDWGQRMEAYGWHVQKCEGNDRRAVADAIQAAIEVTDRPSIIGCRTTIGYGSPGKGGTSSAHGAALGASEVLAAKEQLGLPTDLTFWVPDEVLETYHTAGRRCSSAREEWFARWEGSPSPVFQLGPIPEFTQPEATRNSSGKAITSIAAGSETFVSGCADLAESVKTNIPDEPAQSASNPTGRNLFYGVREHGMAAISNGINLHGGMRSACGTFLVFSDYCRPSIRLAALMHCPSLFVFSHDSIGLGEDGPTHQPVEHVMSLRAIPNLDVWRPADGAETWAAWGAALSRVNGPSALVLTRQSVPQIGDATKAALGGYAVRPEERPKIVLVGTGSEVQLALQAADILAAEGHAAQVVSLPCWEAFERQTPEYRAAVFPENVPIVSVEAGTTLGWQKYASASVGLDHFGASAPAERLYRELGITAEAVADQARRVISSS